MLFFNTSHQEPIHKNRRVQIECTTERVAASSSGVSLDEREGPWEENKNEARRRLSFFRVPFVPCASILFLAERRLGTRQERVSLLEVLPVDRISHTALRPWKIHTIMATKE